jgi:hypothetical protein
MAADIAALVASFRQQAAYCAGDGGSPIYARLFDEIATAIPVHSALQRLLEGNAAAWQAALPLRLAGALHFLALKGEAPELARLFPSCGGAADFAALWPAAREQIARHASTISQFIEHEPQTNEPGRSAVLLPGFLEIDRLTGRPLAVLEIGASAGINLCWDRFSYDLGPYRWGDGTATIRAEWRGPAASFERRPTVVARRGCDRAPLDLTDIETCRRLEAFIWPDHLSRMERLRAAVVLALRETPRVDREDAATWLSARLASRPVGTCTVIVHTIVWQYLGTDAQTAVNAAIDDAAARATAETPLARLWFEPDEDCREYRLMLAIWPGMESRKLAIAHPHGTRIEWRGA